MVQLQGKKTGRHVTQILAPVRSGLEFRPGIPTPAGPLSSACLGGPLTEECTGVVEFRVPMTDLDFGVGTQGGFGEVKFLSRACDLIMI